MFLNFWQKLKAVFSEKEQGLTLLELVVATAIIAIMIVSVTGIFIAALKGQQQAIAAQGVQDSARYILESMTKEIRMSLVTTSEGATDTLNIISNVDGAHVYEFDSINKTIKRDGLDLNPDSQEVEGQFIVTQNTATQASLVTIVLKIKSNNYLPGQNYEISLQGSMASR